jgi:hypothetical protein
MKAQDFHRRSKFSAAKVPIKIPMTSQFFRTVETCAKKAVKMFVPRAVSFAVRFGSERKIF